MHGPHVYISGIYNGKKNLCHKAAVPSTASYNISGTEPSIKYTRRYALDVSTGRIRLAFFECHVILLANQLIADVH